MSKSDNSSGGSQTVDRALVVLKIIASGNRPVLLEEVAARAGLHKSIAYRLLRSLENAGFIGRDQSVGGYVVAATFLSLSVLCVSRLDIRGRARPMMEKIASDHGETVSLHVRVGESRVCVDVVEGTYAVRRVIPIGETLPLFAGETGRALMSELSGPELDPLLRAAVQADLDPVKLKADIVRTRQQGYFIGIGVRTPDVGSISVPVYGSVGILGAVTISGPASRWGRSAMRAALSSILSSVESVTTALGGIPASKRASET
ncbi:IclR family transcriptional regulator [Bradyrhizobium sp. Tv2a-2]|uniref:IclR family transcriptional regulator n=1 Tax=Bradyrhizobium sp. Tv2a-2 TaxID=113395 RepID=UPI0004030E62|nr:IclR family transcriptional regulator [Bradyrhizobium sp. Tv2a-2]